MKATQKYYRISMLDYNFMAKAFSASNKEADIMKARRTIALILSLLMLFGVFSTSASALGETPIGIVEMLSPNTDFNDIKDTDDYRYYRDLLENHQDVITRIYNGIVNREEEINIYEYFIPASYNSALAWIISDCFPEINYKYFLGGSTTTDGFIYYFRFGYPENSDELLREFKRSAAEKYLWLVDDSMDDFTKAVILHDAMILNTFYPQLDSSGEPRGDNYTFMTDDWGVCEYYAEAYAYLLAQCGIKSELVTSTSMGHEWLKIKLDGKYYQVDPTWDDFAPEIYGRLRHFYFLWSDSSFPDHSGYSFMHDADSTKYDSFNQLHNIYT